MRRQHRVKPIQCLNSSLFIHAEHRGMTRWIEIKPDDIGSYGFRSPDRRWPYSGVRADAASVQLLSRSDGRCLCSLPGPQPVCGNSSASIHRQVSYALPTECPSARKAGVSTYSPTDPDDGYPVHPFPTERRCFQRDDGPVPWCRSCFWIMLKLAPSASIRMQSSAKHISGWQRTRLRNAAQFLALLFAQQHFCSPHDY